MPPGHTWPISSMKYSITVDPIVAVVKSDCLDAGDDG
jgi:hypothetical protein